MGTYIVDLMAMFFGMPMALFPAIAEGFGGATALGLLYSALSMGSLIATLSSGWTLHVHRHGRAICLAAVGWGIAIVGFGFAGNLPLALAFLAVAGGADMISGLFRSVMWNSTVPDHLRGRLAGIEQISYSAGPLLGNVESGIAASLIGVRAAVVSGRCSLRHRCRRHRDDPSHPLAVPCGAAGGSARGRRVALRPAAARR